MVERANLRKYWFERKKYPFMLVNYFINRGKLYTYSIYVYSLYVYISFQNRLDIAIYVYSMHFNRSRLPRAYVELSTTPFNNVFYFIFSLYSILLYRNRVCENILF